MIGIRQDLLSSGASSKAFKQIAAQENVGKNDRY
jgi:hypothetical protein